MRKFIGLLIVFICALSVHGQMVTPVGDNKIYPVAQSSMKGGATEFVAAKLIYSMSELNYSRSVASKVHLFKNGVLQGTFRSDLGTYIEFNYSYVSNASGDAKNWVQSRQIVFHPSFTKNYDNTYYAFVAKEGVLYMVNVQTDEIVKTFEGEPLGDYFTITVLSDATKGEGVPDMQVIVSCNGYIQVYSDLLAQEADAEYVDLGLPSGTFWATTNLGASKCENLGNYYSWGETETKGNFWVDNYKWSNSDMTVLTKYNNDSSKGMVDNLFELEAMDDAALVQWGTGWRIPLEEDFAELIQYCTHSWTDINGVKGLRFVGPNGRSIFLPAAGFRAYNNASYVNEMGYYTTRKLYAMESENCILMRFEGEEIHTYWTNFRYYGYPIRPIFKTRTGVSSVTTDRQQGQVKIYDIQGRKKDQLEKGVNIMVGRDGRSQKVLK